MLFYLFITCYENYQRGKYLESSLGLKSPQSCCPDVDALQAITVGAELPNLLHLANAGLTPALLAVPTGEHLALPHYRVFLQTQLLGLSELRLQLLQPVLQDHGLLLLPLQMGRCLLPQPVQVQLQLHHFYSGTTQSTCA